jgi:hypothetical protein
MQMSRLNVSEAALFCALIKKQKAAPNRERLFVSENVYKK